MKKHFKKIIAGLVAVIILAVGGFSLASADESKTKEKSVAPEIEKQARQAAETETGAVAYKVEAESADDDEPAGTAYEVELMKGDTEYEVLLDKNFKVLKVDKQKNEDAVAPGIEKKAKAAAEAETGGKAYKVEAESPDKDDPAETAYEVELMKDNQELEVKLDKNFKVLKVEKD